MRNQAEHPSTALLRAQERVDASRNLSVARSIWPTTHPPAFHSPTYNYEVDRRTRGIAEGRRLARARMERFLGWCRGHRACHGGLVFADRRPSPERAMLDAAESVQAVDRLNAEFVAAHCSWRWQQRVHEARWTDGLGFVDLGNVSAERRDKATAALLAVVVDLLASPEWAALPWQREAGR